MTKPFAKRTTKPHFEHGSWVDVPIRINGQRTLGVQKENVHRPGNIYFQCWDRWWKITAKDLARCENIELPESRAK